MFVGRGACSMTRFENVCGKFDNVSTTFCKGVYFFLARYPLATSNKQNIAVLTAHTYYIDNSISLEGKNYFHLSRAVRVVEWD